MNKQHSIYIIDDEQIDLLIAQRYLKQVMPSVEVTSFSSATAALTQIQQLQQQGKLVPGLILLDINMPIVNGWQFLEAYQALTCSSEQKSIIYLLSSSIHFLDQNKAKTYPMVEDLLCKPFSIDHIQQLKQKHF